MGMYTELIFGCSLKEETPLEVIETLQYMLGEWVGQPENLQFKSKSGRWLLLNSSYCFGVCENVNKMWFDDITNQWHISTRSNLKNYEREIEDFLEWIKTYIDEGSGNRNMYAITIYEDSELPEIYFLDNE